MRNWLSSLERGLKAVPRKVDSLLDWIWKGLQEDRLVDLIAVVMCLISAGILGYFAQSLLMTR